ncbi:MAG: alkaline phosphatase [Oscillibacter sp.]|nr:alkaline phosphatase [Oscillibacter sp.]
MKRIFYFMVFIAVAVMLLPQCQQAPQGKKAKYVFYFIGDGMGVNQVNGTEMYLAEKEGRIGVKALNFTQFPVVNFATTYSKYNSVTCSAAAGTALATGTKTKNGTIGMDSLHKAPLYSVAVKAKEAGKRVGITTSVSVDHATPSAFYAHQPSRSMYYEIGTDLPKTGFDFYAGSGFLQPKSKKDSTAPELTGLIEEAGYKIIRGNEAFEKEYADAAKAVFIQKEGSEKGCLPYAIDRKEGDLTLAQITENAIRFLMKEPNDGFFLMVEGGKIDWACHGNDAATVFEEIVDMAEAVQKALDFYNQHPDETLIVITADHETGGIGLGTGRYALNLQALQHQKLSQEQLTHEIQALRTVKKNKVSWEDVRGLLSEKLGFWKEVKLSDKQEARLKDIYTKSFGKGVAKMEKDLYAENEQLAAEAIRIMDAIALVGWTSGGHSAGVVPVYAIGAGSQLFTGKLDNTDIPKKIAEAGGY